MAALEQAVDVGRMARQGERRLRDVVPWLGPDALRELRPSQGQRAARETMMMVAGSVETYGSRGETVSVERRARLVDEAI